MYKKLFTSESVGAGHPDKICDQISDSILDKILAQDKDARVACEVMASNRFIIIGGEITTKGYVDVVSTAWSIINILGYNENDFTIISNVNKQSPDIKQTVDKKSGIIGAGDQGIVFGYATNETPQFMPLPIVLAHELNKLAEKLRIEKRFKWAKSDMKSQVTIDYQNEKPIIDNILMSIQHDPNYKKEEFKSYIKNNIMNVIAEKYKLNTKFDFYVNPSGKFVVGGPIGDSGLTGRKIIVDTYGGKGRHGGGAFSGKDYTKVDRFGSYAARWIAKNVVAAELASEFEIQISYGIGLVKPLSISIDTFQTEKIELKKIKEAILKTFDLSPSGIIKALDLKRPIYSQVSIFGHFGRDDLNLPWEKLNKVNDLKKYISSN